VAALYLPLRLRHASFGFPAAMCPSIFSAATAMCFAWSPLSPTVIFLLIRWLACYNSFCCCCSAALLLLSTHVGAEIHWLHGWDRVGGITTPRQSLSMRVSSLSLGPWGSLPGNFAIHLQ
jgi:hypothetical protein